MFVDRFLDAPEIHRPVDVKVIDKAVDRIVEVFQKKPVAKVVERLVEKIEVHDVDEVKEFHVTQLIPEVQVSNFVPKTCSGRRFTVEPSGAAKGGLWNKEKLANGKNCPTFGFYVYFSKFSRYFCEHRSSCVSKYSAPQVYVSAVDMRKDSM